MSTKAYDLVIRSGTVVDGLGGTPFLGDVAIREGRIAAIGHVDGQGREEIDAAGRLVTPGFVDIHTHYDGQITWEHSLRPSAYHGVTTVVMGNCGVGFAPVRPDQREMVVSLMEGVEEIPEVVMTAGVPWNWESFPDYLDAIGGRPCDVDFAAQLPHSPLRVYVMGERGANLEPPTESDLADMRRLTAEALSAGALGVSSSRQLAHRFSDGRPAPSLFTEKDELLALAGGLRDAGTGVFQLAPNTNNPPEEEFALVRMMAEASGRPASFSILSNDEMSPRWRSYVDLMEAAIADGLAIHGQILPRPAGAMFGLDLTFHPFVLNPSYRPIADLPLAEKVKAMRNPELRRKIVSESPDGPNPFIAWVVTQTHLLFPLGSPPNYAPEIDDNLSARAQRAGIDPKELIYDELLKDEGKAIIYFPMGTTGDGRFDGSTDMFGRPGVVVALGDGGAHYGSVCDAAYTTFMLTQYVRGSASTAYRMPVETAVKMLTADPARAVGLEDRGVLAPGYKGDANVIDLDSLQLHRPEVQRDLPAGGKRLMQLADGYDCTIVSGTVTYRRGEPTGALPGRLVRGQQPRPAR